MPSTVALLGIALMSCVMSAAVLGSLLSARVRGVGRWCAAYGLFSVGIVSVFARAHTSPRLGITFSIGLFLAASFIILQGAREFFGARKAMTAEYAAVFGVYLLLLYFIYVKPNLDARVAVSSAYFAYVRGVVGWTALRYRPRQRPKYSYYFLSISAFVGTGLHIARSAAYGLGLNHQVAFLDPSPLNIAFLGLGILSFPFLSIGMVLVAHDQLAQRMERLATVDELTGALVRRAFMERAAASGTAAQAIGAPVALAILDLDNFKAVNDRYGHAAGDGALEHFASTVLQALRPGDLFGRLGGEEFAVLFPATREAEALRLTNDLRVAIAARPCGRTPYTFSAGVGEFAPNEKLASVLARADAALYTAKALGRDCVVLASSHGEPEHLAAAE